jgi:chaperone modulatory protein CbpM
MRHAHQGQIDFTLTLTELSRCCDVSTERIIVLVDQGILAPVGANRENWQFQSSDLQRARCALRLERDLGLNAAGAALAVELLEELEHARRRLRTLESLIS